MDWLNNRANEPTTWGGLGLIAVALGQIFGSAEVASGGTAGTQVATEALGQGLPWWQAVILGVGGGLMALKREKAEQGHGLSTPMSKSPE